MNDCDSKGDEPMYTSGVWIVKKGCEDEFESSGK